MKFEECKGWNRDRLRSVGATLSLLAYCVTLACALAWFVYRYG